MMTQRLHARILRAAAGHKGERRAWTRALPLGAAALVLLACAPSLRAQVQLPAGSAHFTIVQGSKSLGDAQYSLTPVTGGYTMASSGHMTLATFSYSFHSQVTVDSALNLVHDALTGSVNGTKVHATNVAFNTASDPTGRDFQISVNADGKQTTNTIDRHRNTVLVPDLDPGAYMLMARIALAQPQTAWVLIPKENGILVPAEYQAEADLRGSFNGANINVKHTTAILSDANSITLELFYTGDGRLLEADLNAQNLDVVRDGFKLFDKPAPTPPPPGQAPPQPGQQQAAPQQSAPMPQQQ